jgi:hypothetical protein
MISRSALKRQFPLLESGYKAGVPLGFCLLRRQAARVPKKAPAAVKTQIVMVTAISLVVIIPASPFEAEFLLSSPSHDSLLIALTQVKTGIIQGHCYFE